MAKILVVDEENVATAIKINLRRDYQVTTCDPHEALNMIREEIFDLIIVDFHMPDIDAMTLANLIKKEGNNIKTIVITGIGHLVKHLSSTATILNKPFTKKELVDAVKEILEAHQEVKEIRVIYA